MKKFNFNFTFIVLGALIFFIHGCGVPSSLMTRGKFVEPVSNDDVIVTFLRPSSLGGGIWFGIWDKKNCVGILHHGAYIQYKTNPGKHLFLAEMRDQWYYIKANLAPGKQYFIQTKVFFPGTKMGFDPVNKADNVSQSKIDNWLKNLKSTIAIPKKLDDYENPRLSKVKFAIDNFESGGEKYMLLEAEDGRNIERSL